uniref:RNase H type-1 domain-containing protein n=1 Tax=Rousettus aegyptiacus TaxID=9407 RepID=A0A7J8EZT8_ROUAE|nr:hypothetical protein HJG63_012233 [Rousettus aegyptiacus]
MTYSRIPGSPPRPAEDQLLQSYYHQRNLLSDPDPETPVHDCIDFTDTVCSSQPDFEDSPLPEASEVLFMDGGGFMQEGRRYTGTVVVTLTGTIWSQALPHGTSAQKAELITLTEALRWGKDITVTIYSDG